MKDETDEQLIVALADMKPSFIAGRAMSIDRAMARHEASIAGWEEELVEKKATLASLKRRHAILMGVTVI